MFHIFYSMIPLQTWLDQYCLLSIPPFNMDTFHDFVSDMLMWHAWEVNYYTCRVRAQFCVKDITTKVQSRIVIIFIYDNSYHNFLTHSYDSIVISQYKPKVTRVIIIFEPPSSDSYHKLKWLSMDDLRPSFHYIKTGHLSSNLKQKVPSKNLVLFGHKPPPLWILLQVEDNIQGLCT